MIRHGRGEALFHELVSRAQRRSRVRLPDMVEGYLVLTLLRHLGTEAAQALYQRLAPRLLAGRVHGEPSLRDTGDACLMLAGLFPEQAQRRHVSVGYFIRIGRTAYARLAAAGSGGELFAELCRWFPGLVNVLQAMRSEERELNLMAAFETWAATGNPDLLRELTDAVPILPDQRRPL